MVPRRLPDLPVAEGHERPPTSAYAESQLPDRMVSLPSYPHAMAAELPLEKLDGTVEMDETYVGGKKIGWGVYAGRSPRKSLSVSGSAAANSDSFMPRMPRLDTGEVHQGKHLR